MWQRSARSSRRRPPTSWRSGFFVGAVLSVTAVVAGAACTATIGRRDGPMGSGRVVADTRAVTGFSAIDLRGVGQLMVTLSDQEGLTVEAEDNLLPQITSTVSGDTLILNLEAGRPTRPIVYRVAARQITALSTSGAGDVEAPGLTGPRLRTSQSGAGSIRLERLSAQLLESSLSGAGSLDADGTASRLVVNQTGAGNVAARDLAVQDADLTMSGAGNATVRVSNTLQVRLTGAGNVEYLGNPRVESSVTGGGTVRPISGS
jgi:Putative auto-transporter adhesin, head GIN domain